MHTNEAYLLHLRHHWIVFVVLSIAAIPTLADTRKQKWVFTGNLNYGRMWHSGIMLKNGKLLVTGGVGNAG